MLSQGFEGDRRVLKNNITITITIELNLEAWYKLEGSADYHLMDTDTYIGYW